MKYSIAALALYGVASAFVSRAVYPANLGESESCADAGAYVPEIEERWKAGSTTAMAITGDITFSRAKIQFANGVTGQLHHLGNVKEDTADKYTTFQNAQCVALYAVDPPVTENVLSGNRLCGYHESTGKPADPLTHIAVRISADRKWLTLAAYSQGTARILMSKYSGKECGTFGFFRD